MGMNYQITNTRYTGLCFFSGNPVCVSLTWRKTLEEFSSYKLVGIHGSGKNIPQFCVPELAKNYKGV